MGKKVKWVAIDDAGFCNGLFDSEERSVREAAGQAPDSARVESRSA